MESIFFQLLGSKRIQEDCIITFVAHDESRVIGIADGHNGVETAHMCCTRVQELWDASCDATISHKYERVYKSLAKETKKHRSGATLSLVCIAPDFSYATAAIVGDSPIIVGAETQTYMFLGHNVRDTQCRQEAQDRGAVYQYGYIHKRKKCGDLTDESIQLARTFGNKTLRHVLSRTPDIYTIEHPQYIVVASDGIYDFDATTDKESCLTQICVALQKKQDIQQIFMRKQHFLRDNTSLVAVRNDG